MPEQHTIIEAFAAIAAEMKDQGSSKKSHWSISPMCLGPHFPIYLVCVVKPSTPAQTNGWTGYASLLPLGFNERSPSFPITLTLLAF
ncbi:MAG TPA: hypothetical protein DD706_19605 [Nitrospiraceae bacterium]|nr:hypothetical protein [Nitrospiraceae bacterium]